MSDEDTGSALIGLGVILVVLLFIVLAIVGWVGLSLSPIQDGDYTGQVIDYSNQRGIIFKTNDLTTKTNDRSSETEDWCVPDNDPELVNKVQNIENGDKVKINYHRPLWIWIDTCQNGLKVIDSIEVVNQTSA